MKKVFLNCMLLLCALIAGSSSVWATDATAKWTASSGGLGSGVGSGTFTDNKSNTWSYTRTLSSGTSYTGWTSNCIQLGKNGGVEHLTLSTSAYASYTIKSVSIECSSYNAAHKVAIQVGSTTYLALTATPSWTTVSAKTGTGTSSGNITITFTDGSRALYIKSITVTYIDQPAAPTFNVSAGEFNAAFDLTISSAEGTTLKYTTDGTDPSTSGSAIPVATNSAVVSIPAATTRVRAIAIKGGNNSDETDATYTYSSKAEPSFTLSPSSLNLKVGANGAVTLTTNSDGDITFSCDDAHVTLSGTGNSRTVSADAEGNYTVNVSVAATSTYMSKAGSVTVSVTKHSTSIAIDASSINSELKNGHDGGTLSASVTYGDPAAAVPESSVTWTSSNSSVATVGYSTGVVTLLKSGNTTITATYAATTAYAGSTKTYALSVTDSRNKFEWDLSTDSYDADPTEALISWSNGRANMKNEKKTSTTSVINYIPTSESSTRFYKNQILTITPVAGYRISSVEFEATTNGYATALKNSTWTNATAFASEKIVIVTPSNGNNAISATIGATCGFTKVTVCYDVVVTIGAAKWATFSCSDPIDFTGIENLTAYLVEGVIGSTLDLSDAQSQVPASTGLLLNGEAGSYEIPVIASASSVGTNKLVACTSATNLSKNKDYYVLVNNGGAVFQSLEDNGATIPAGKAYLDLSSGSGAPSIIRIVDEENNATSINDIEASDKAVKFIENGRILILRDGIIYDALGRKIR